MTEEVKPKEPLSHADLSIAFAIPAPAANKFYVTTGGTGIRISFCEQAHIGGLPQPRVAVTLSLDDGIQLYKVLQGVLKEYESIVDSIRASQTPTEPQNAE